MSACTFLAGSPATVQPVLSVRQYYPIAAAANSIALVDTRLTTSSVVSCNILGVRADVPTTLPTPTLIAGNANLIHAQVATSAIEVQWTVMKF